MATDGVVKRGTRAPPAKVRAVGARGDRSRAAAGDLVGAAANGPAIEKQPT